MMNRFATAARDAIESIVEDDPESAWMMEHVESIADAAERDGHVGFSRAFDEMLSKRYGVPLGVLRGEMSAEDWLKGDQRDFDLLHGTGDPGFIGLTRSEPLARG